MALAAAFALPVSVAAASPYQVNVAINDCGHQGGAHGRGYIQIKLSLQEVGKSGTTHFVVSSELQASSGLGFSTQHSYPKQSSETFPNDKLSYSTAAKHDVMRP